MKRFDERKAPVVVLWITVLVIGTAIVSVSYVDYKKETRDVEALFEAHVASVMLLINEGTREATASISLMYEISENQLLTVAELLGSVSEAHRDSWRHLKSEHRMAVWVSADETGRFSGEWGPVREKERADFVAWMRDSESESLVDDGPLRRLALACIRLAPDDGAARIVCRDANALKRHRRNIGIGPLLKGVTQKDIRYVALQDGEGILAVAPSPELVSRFDTDSFLVDALKRRTPDAGGRFRIRRLGEETIFEGVVPFKMADESIVLLRIGIDGAMLTEVKQNAASRFAITVGWTVAGILLATLLFVLLRRWQRKRVELGKRIETEAAARKHWEDIGQMAATVAHEVRNPLNTMGMISQRLRSEIAVLPEDAATFDEMIALMISEGHRVEKVVNDFLALGKPVRLERAPRGLGALLDEAMRSLEMRAENEGKRLILAKSVPPVTLNVDEKRFRQMLTNLVENALDAVDTGGKVTLDARDFEDRVDIVVRDNGKGLDDDKLENVFKPFVSFKSTGNGLGLPLVKRWADAHGGRVTLTRNDGRGLCATLSLPTTRME